MTTTTKSRKTTATEATEAPARKTRSRRQPTEAIRTRTGDDTCDTCGKESATLHFNEETGAAVCDRCTLGTKANSNGHVRPAKYTSHDLAKLPADEKRALSIVLARRHDDDGVSLSALAKEYGSYGPYMGTMVKNGRAFIAADAAAAPAKKSRKRTA